VEVAVGDDAVVDDDTVWAAEEEDWGEQDGAAGAADEDEEEEDGEIRSLSIGRLGGGERGENAKAEGRAEEEKESGRGRRWAKRDREGEHDGGEGVADRAHAMVRDEENQLEVRTSTELSTSTGRPTEGGPPRGLVARGPDPSLAENFEAAEVRD
jgi:hypothetical protein